MGSIIASLHGRQGAFTLDVDFTAPASGITGLFGPSGCGKSTILRCLAGLTHFRGNRLIVDDVIWQDERHFIPPHHRPVGYVFQEPHLFTHLSVRQNLNYGLKRAGKGPQKMAFDQVSALLGIQALLERSVFGLSGGEKQRIAIARALLSQPELLLMDEPLSALDKASRNDILPYLEALHDSLGLPIIYVTHDFSEIERLADHLILMERGGKIRASGALDALTTDLSLPIAHEPEAGTVLKVKVSTYDEAFDISDCVADGVHFQVPGRLGSTGTVRRLQIRASDVSIATGTRPQGSSLLNIFAAHICQTQEISHSQILILLELDETAAPVRIVSSVTRKSWQTLNLKSGQAVFAQVKGMALADLR